MFRAPSASATSSVCRSFSRWGAKSSSIPIFPRGEPMAHVVRPAPSSFLRISRAAASVRSETLISVRVANFQSVQTVSAHGRNLPVHRRARLVGEGVKPGHVHFSSPFASCFFNYNLVFPALQERKIRNSRGKAIFARTFTIIPFKKRFLQMHPRVILCSSHNISI